MQCNLNNTANSFLKLAANVAEAKIAEKLQEVNNNVQPEQINPNNTLERTGEQDSFSLSDQNVETGKKALRAASAITLAGFCFGFSPLLFVGATAAFLFMNKDNEGFKEKLVNTIAGDLKALDQFRQQMQTQNAENAPEANKAQSNAPQAAPQVKAPQAEAPVQKPESKVSNPIETKAPEQKEQAEEKKEMTPFERIMHRYEKAQEYQSRAEMNLQKKEEAQRVAEEKVNVAQAKLDQAQAEYDKANAQMKMQMTDKMMKLQENLSAKQSNATVAKEKTDVARALLEEAGVKLAKAQRAMEDAQAEQIVAG